MACNRAVDPEGNFSSVLARSRGKLCPSSLSVNVILFHVYFSAFVGVRRRRPENLPHGGGRGTGA